MTEPNRKERIVYWCALAFLLANVVYYGRNGWRWTVGVENSIAALHQRLSRIEQALSLPQQQQRPSAVVPVEPKLEEESVKPQKE